MPGVTTTADKELVRCMVETYMKNPRTVMLAIVPANVDPATQEILEMAKEVDPGCHRTIGVMTKPDLVDKGAEHKVMEMIEGKNSQTSLDWSIVRNSGQQELNDSTMDRGTIEELFFRRTAPWNALSHERRGIDSLRTRLEEVLTKHIHREFPKVKAEISKKLNTCKRTLAALSSERDTADKQARYLLDIAVQFQHVASLAINAEYGGSDIFDTTTGLCLATALVNRNEQFSHDMERRGHQYHFIKDDPTADDSSSASDEDDSSSASDEDDSSSASDEDFTRVVITRRVAHALELDEILPFEENAVRPSSLDICEWLKETYRKSRGFELGTFNPSLLTAVMRQQSCNWHAISLGYVSDAIALVHDFITKLLQSLCGDPQLCEHLLNLLLDGLLEKYRQGLAQVNLLLEVELSGVPMTLNHYFSDNLEKRRRGRMEAELALQAVFCEHHGVDVVPLNKIVENHPMSNADHAIQDIHDTLYAYYKVARKRFVDNCCLHAASYHLIHGPHTPLKLFSPSFVCGLSKEQLEEVAGEDAELKRKRAQLKKEIQDLERGRNVVML